MPKPRLLTLAEAEKTGRGHPEWEAMNKTERREYVRKVNEAIKSEAAAPAIRFTVPTFVPPFDSRPCRQFARCALD